MSSSQEGTPLFVDTATMMESPSTDNDVLVSPKENTSLMTERMSEEEHLIIQPTVTEELAPSVIAVSMQPLAQTFAEDTDNGIYDVDSVEEKALEKEYDMEENVGDTGSNFKHAGQLNHDDQQMMFSEGSAEAAPSKDEQPEDEIRQPPRKSCMEVEPPEETRGSLRCVPVVEDVSHESGNGIRQLALVPVAPVLMGLKCSSLCDTLYPETSGQAPKRSAISQEYLSMVDRNSGPQAKPPAQDPRTCTASKTGSMWSGFRRNFPNYADDPRYKPSRLLDLTTDMDVLKKSNTKMKGVNFKSVSPVRSLPTSVVKPSTHSCSRRKKEISEESSRETVPDYEDITELLHTFPCHCPQKCVGKLARTYKKDNRTWLWKNKESRETALREGVQNVGCNKTAT